MLDQTHAPGLRSFVASANGHADFPIQNLPLGIFSNDGHKPRGGVAIGDFVVDIVGLAQAGLLTGDAAQAAEATAGGTLNALFALGAPARQALRLALSALLAEGSTWEQEIENFLYSVSDVTMHMPATIGDYTDFYAGIQHAENVGRQFRPDNPLLPNYKYVPIGYHGRASSVVLTGTALHRPKGQRKPASETVPSYGPCRNLDYELELGIWIGPGNAMGEEIEIADAASHIAGYCLLNDWSARDIQGWEYQPLGPFLAKNFGTTISPWVITPEALAPFRITQAPRPEGDPAPLPYLWNEADQSEGALDLRIDVLLMTPGLKEKGLAPHLLGSSNTKYLYWTPAQFVAHHSCNGCNLNPGDLFGSGTISGPTESSFGSLLEITNGGRKPIMLASGEDRRFLEDGDEIFLVARAEKAGAVSIGFGECHGRILPVR